MKLTSKKIILIMFIIFFIWFLFYSLQPFWWSFMDFTNPNYYSEVKRTWQSKNFSNKYLLMQLQSRSVTYSGVAANILAERKDNETILPLMKIANNSKEEEIRGVAIGLLSNFYYDPSVKHFLGDIMKRGRTDINYLNTVRILSTLKDEQAFQELLKMAKDSYKTAYVIGCLENYIDMPETRKVLEKIASEDPEGYVRQDAKVLLKKLNTGEVQKQ